MIKNITEMVLNHIWLRWQQVQGSQEAICHLFEGLFLPDLMILREKKTRYVVSI